MNKIKLIYHNESKVSNFNARNNLILNEAFR